MNTPDRMAKPGWGAVVRHSVRHDPVLLPTVLIALVGTGFAVFAPAPWLARVPTAVIDVTTGAREHVVGERDQLAAREAALMQQLEAEQAELAAARQALVQAQGRTDENAGALEDLRAEVARRTAALEEVSAERGRLAAELEFAQARERDALSQQMAALEAEAGRASGLQGRLDANQQELADTVRALEACRRTCDLVHRGAARERPKISLEYTPGFTGGPGSGPRKDRQRRPL